MTDITRRWYPLVGPLSTERGTTPTVLKPAKVRGPIDPLTSPKIGLAGRVVTMNDSWTVRPDAVLFIEKGIIVAVQDREQPAPAGFETVPVVETGGTIFPGLIELHNHLSYNALPLWNPVPKRFEHRGQWPDHPDYRKLISGPMTVVGKYRDAQGKPALLAPLVRYVECKCLLGGTTTSQGIMLSSNAGVQRYYRGIVRNVERTDDVHLSEAQGRIPDVDAKSAKAFFTRLNKEDSCYLLHLSEGITKPGQTDSVARKHFRALEVAPNQWALNDRFTGIHAAGLLPEDFEVLARHGSSMVWSPFSNLLLYGDTARVEAAKQAGVRIGLGSDWSPSGSKNLLGELKVAWLYSQQMLNGLFSAREVVALATREPAKILKWHDAIGTLEAGKCADVLVIDGTGGDPYEALIHAKEQAISLVMINGVARYGLTALMKALATTGETVRVGGEARRLFLEQATADPDVARLSLSAAHSALHEALLNLPKLARELEKPTPKATRRLALDAPEPVVWTLALDEIQETGTGLRPRLPFKGPRDFTGPKHTASRGAAIPLSRLLQPIALDSLTVANDPNFLSAIAGQPNLPEPIKTGLGRLY